LLQEHAAFESIHNRAATLIFATAFTSSLLGGQALADGLGGVWEWLAVAFLIGIGALAALVLWPYYNLSWRFDPTELLATYVDSEPPATMSGIHRDLALRIKLTGKGTVGFSGACGKRSSSPSCCCCSI
jgi:hypothetical protein